MRLSFPLLLLLILLCGGCQSCPPATQALVLAPNFRTPEDAGRSFFAAIACNDAQAEYRCLGESLKETYGATLDLYLLARPQIRSQLGAAAGQAWRLQVVEQSETPNGILLWWGLQQKPRLGLLFQAQSFYDITDITGRRTGALLAESPDHYLRVSGKHLAIELQHPALRSVRSQNPVQHFELGTEWKIAAILDPQQQGRMGDSLPQP